MKLFRYLFSGGTGAAANLGLLYVLTDIVGLYYIVSGIISFCCAVVVSFFMQKRWTFQDHSEGRTHHKFGIFFLVAVANLCINTLLLYLFTDIASIHYLISQIIASGIVAVWSYYIYRVIFKKSGTID